MLFLDESFLDYFADDVLVGLGFLMVVLNCI